MATAIAAMFASSTAATAGTAAVTTAAGTVSTSAALSGLTAGGAGVFQGAASGLGGFLSGLSLSTGDLISGALTGISAIGDISAGNAEAEALELEASLKGLQAEQETLQGRKDALDATIQLNDVLSSNLAGGFGAGLRSSGSVSQASVNAKQEADFTRDLVRSTAKIRAMSKGIEANVDRKRAANARSGGVMKAVGRVAGFAQRVNDRGTKTETGPKKTGSLFDFA